jgi:hypothetical protein
MDSMFWTSIVVYGLFLELFARWSRRTKDAASSVGFLWAYYLAFLA